MLAYNSALTSSSGHPVALVTMIPEVCPPCHHWNMENASFKYRSHCFVFFLTAVPSFLLKMLVFMQWSIFWWDNIIFSTSQLNILSAVNKDKADQSRRFPSSDPKSFFLSWTTNKDHRWTQLCQLSTSQNSGWLSTGLERCPVVLFCLSVRWLHLQCEQEKKVCLGLLCANKVNDKIIYWMTHQRERRLKAVEAFTFYRAVEPNVSATALGFRFALKVSENNSERAVCG